MTGGPIACPRASDTPPIWQLNRLALLSWKQYGDEYVVFNEGSGDLHLLEGLAALTLRLIAE
ncbi:MAG TPA: hypothetical protein VNN07_13335, partial [Candidatus Tectomicrobia bacterium]|nr:hypothetical protein [Candidatus Tectomicrobia bacterium]